MQLQSAGIDLSALIAAGCRYFEVDENEQDSSTKRLEIARARALNRHIATRDLSISGSEVAERLSVDRSAMVRNPKDELKTGTMHAMLDQLGLTIDDLKNQ